MVFWTGGTGACDGRPGTPSRFSPGSGGKGELAGLLASSSGLMCVNAGAVLMAGLEHLAGSHPVAAARSARSACSCCTSWDRSCASGWERADPPASDASRPSSRSSVLVHWAGAPVSVARSPHPLSYGLAWPQGAHRHGRGTHRRHATHRRGHRGAGSCGRTHRWHARHAHRRTHRRCPGRHGHGQAPEEPGCLLLMPSSPYGKKVCEPPIYRDRTCPWPDLHQCCVPCRPRSPGSDHHPQLRRRCSLGMWHRVVTGAFDPRGPGCGPCGRGSQPDHLARHRASAPVPAAAGLARSNISPAPRPMRPPIPAPPTPAQPGEDIISGRGVP